MILWTRRGVMWIGPVADEPVIPRFDIQGLDQLVDRLSRLSSSRLLMAQFDGVECSQRRKLIEEDRPAMA